MITSFKIGVLILQIPTNDTLDESSERSACSTGSIAFLNLTVKTASKSVDFLRIYEQKYVGSFWLTVYQRFFVMQHGGRRADAIKSAAAGPAAGV